MLLLTLYVFRPTPNVMYLSTYIYVKIGEIDQKTLNLVRF